ncbi:ABC Superfamily, partial [Phytophthora palmivora]
MVCVNTVGSRALLIGGVAAWLTSMSTGKEWLTKDYVFVVAVVVVVFLGGIRTAKYEHLMQHEKLQRAHDLEKIEFIHGNPVQLELNTVTCILFFGTWCKKSREALEVLSYLNEAHSHEGAIQQICIGQLAMYEVKGRDATNFRELKEFAFSIGIETGFMAKDTFGSTRTMSLLHGRSIFLRGVRRLETVHREPIASLWLGRRPASIVLPALGNGVLRFSTAALDDDKKKKQQVQQMKPKALNALSGMGLDQNLDTKEAKEIKQKVLVSAGLVMAAKALTIQVPFIFKDLVNSVGEASTVLAGSPATSVFPNRNAVFATVAQKTIRKVAVRVFNHLHAMDLKFHLDRQT